MPNPHKIKSNAVAVLGTGAWGTALAIVLARNGVKVKLWGKFPEEVAHLATERCNAVYLPGILFPDNIEMYTELSLAIAEVNDILIAVPSHAFQSTLEQLKPHITAHNRLFWATKGLDLHNQLLHETVIQIIGEIPMAVISGPTFAHEVAHSKPSAITAASNDPNFAQDIASYFHCETFRVYTNTDLIGTQICGVVKNVLAIAVGISDGLDLGANARCALITRGLAELTRLGKALGGKTETFMGLAGIGDLVLTCTDNKSRNRRFGIAIGQGIARTQAEETISQIIEGIPNARSVYFLAKKYAIEMSIIEQVYLILYHDLPIATALDTLLNRSQKAEF